MEPETTEKTQVGSRKAEVVTPRIEWEYAPSRESTDIVEVADRYELFIDGEYRKPKSGKYFPTINPATEEELAEVAEAGPEDVDAAVEAARAAFEDGWGRMPGSERAKYIFRIARMIQERSRELAAPGTLAGGQPIKESRVVDRPPRAANLCYYGG